METQAPAAVTSSMALTKREICHTLDALGIPWTLPEPSHDILATISTHLFELDGDRSLPLAFPFGGDGLCREIVVPISLPSAPATEELLAAISEATLRSQKAPLRFRRMRAPEPPDDDFWEPFVCLSDTEDDLEEAILCILRPMEAYAHLISHVERNGELPPILLAEAHEHYEAWCIIAQDWEMYATLPRI